MVFGPVKLSKQIEQSTCFLKFFRRDSIAKFKCKADNALFVEQRAICETHLSILLLVDCENL